MPLPSSTDYEEIPRSALIGSRIISDTYERLGKPTSPFSQKGEKMMECIIWLWTKMKPDEVKEWTDEKRLYQNSELTISEQVHKKTGRSLASVPSFVYDIMCKVFPRFKSADRKVWIKFVGKYPMFRMANKV